MCDVKVRVYLYFFKKESFFASKISLLSPFATNKKRRGESGHPCLKPLLEREKGEVDPLMRKIKEAVEIHAQIHFMKG